MAWLCHDLLSVREHRELCSTSQDITHRDLSELMQKGILKREGKGRATHYRMIIGWFESSIHNQSWQRSSAQAGFGSRTRGFKNPYRTTDLGGKPRILSSFGQKSNASIVCNFYVHCRSILEANFQPKMSHKCALYKLLTLSPTYCTVLTLGLYWKRKW